MNREREGNTVQQEKRIQQLGDILPYVSAGLRTALSEQVMSIRRLTEENGCRDEARQIALLQQATYRMMRLANNLSAASLLCEDTPFPRRNEELVAWCAEQCLLAEGLFAVKGVSLLWETLLRYCTVGVNVQHLEFMLWQLLSNALKFTPRGGNVRVTLKTAGEQVLLSVTDNGCGMSDELAEVAMDRVLHTERIDPPIHGLGLGLVLSRKIMQRHGGRLLLDSRPGAGTTVTAALPNTRAVCEEEALMRGDYAGGFSHVHVGLSDALPIEAFSPAYLDQ